MAPFRQQGRLNRSGRTQADHDVFEGLPIRQWRTTDVTIAPPPQQQSVVDTNALPELPMPRDSHLLPEHSQQLLRAARAGRAAKTPTASTEEDKENEDGDEDSKEVLRGFSVKRYTKLTRQQEESEVEYLAKRRKGLPSPHSVQNVIPVPAVPTIAATQVPMRKTKVRKTDAAGNVQIWEVLVPEGQTVEGEVLEAEAAAIEPTPAAVPGTVVEGVGVVNAEGVVVAGGLAPPASVRKRDRSKKKKSKGSSKKKKVAFSTGLPGAVGAVPADGIQQPGLAIPGTTPDSTTPAGPSDGDTPMGEAHDGKDDDKDDDDDSDDGEEGDDDSDREDGEVTESPRKPTLEPLQSEPESMSVEVQMTDVPPAAIPTESEQIPAPSVEVTAATSLSEPLVTQETSASNLEPPPGPSREPSSSPDLPLAAAISHSWSASAHQIPAIQSSAPAPPPASVPAPAELPNPPAPMEPEVQLQPPLEPQATEIPVTSEPISAEPVVEAPVLPLPIPSIATESQPPAPQEPPAEVPAPAPAPVSPQATIPPPAPIEPAVQSDPSIITEAPTTIGEPESATPESMQSTEDVHFPDGVLDLLGSLERHLENESKGPTL